MRSHSCSESTQKTVRMTLKHRKTDVFIFAAFRNLCLKCTYCFSFPISQTKGHSLNCFSTVIAQTTVRKHKFQHLKHKKTQKRCLPKLNSNLTLSLGDKRDTCQQNSSALHKHAKNLASVSALPVALYHGKAQLITPFLANKGSLPLTTSPSEGMTVNWVKT